MSKRNEDGNKGKIGRGRRPPLKKKKPVDPTHVQIIKCLCLNFQDRIYGPADELNMVSVTVDEKYYKNDTLSKLSESLKSLNSNIATKMVIEKNSSSTENNDENTVTVNVFYGDSEDHVNTIVKNHFNLTEEELSEDPIIIK